MIRYFTITAFLGLAATLLTGCGGGGGSSPAQTNSFYSSYQAGTQWTYKYRKAGDESEYIQIDTILGTEKVNGLNCLHVESAINRPLAIGEPIYSWSKDDIYVTAKDSNGVIRQSGYMRSMGYMPNEPFTILPPIPVCDFTTSLSNGTIVSGKILSTQTEISTISGTYRDAVKLEIRAKGPFSNSKLYVWLVPGIGVVKEQSINSDNEIEFERELVSFIPKLGSADVVIR